MKNNSGSVLRAALYLVVTATIAVIVYNIYARRRQITMDQPTDYLSYGLPGYSIMGTDTDSTLKITGVGPEILVIATVNKAHSTIRGTVWRLGTSTVLATFGGIHRKREEIQMKISTGEVEYRNRIAMQITDILMRIGYEPDIRIKHDGKEIIYQKGHEIRIVPAEKEQPTPKLAPKKANLAHLAHRGQEIGRGFLL